ncbi:MAG: hypothetical protein PF549_00265 [Patescibacteria group bacterium]|jgi:predicted transcriptional regulator of viral defense system|nr:hypothetical protein [Patescibacteria group bacterium]
MTYLELKDNLKDFVVFSINDILKIDHNFHKQRLSEWQKKGYVKKISKGFYFFTDLEINESALFIIANTIYQPSYISLEMALSYYNLIPEGVYLITSVTTKLTREHKSEVGHFIYRKIKPELMFGYKLVKYGNHVFKMAEIEKAILDYFYGNSRFKTENEFEELRFNKDIFLEQVDIEKLKRYLEQFENKELEKRVNNFIKFINHA